MRATWRNVHGFLVAAVFTISAAPGPDVLAARFLYPDPRFGVGWLPVALAATDIDGNGFPDIVTANSGSDDVSVVFTDARGATERRFSAGDGPLALGVADFNRDGRPDLAVASSSPTAQAWEVSILAGAGDGFFAARRVVLSGTVGPPSALVVADFNGDGAADVATLSAESGMLSILVGRGDGTFVVGPVEAGLSWSADMATADFDADGRSDLVVGSGTDAGVTVLFGAANGGLEDRSTLAAGEAPRTVAQGDLDGDGRPDILTVDWANGDVYVFLARGSRGFGTPFFEACGQSPQALAVGDFDADGRADVALGPSIAVMSGDGEGRLSPPGVPHEPSTSATALAAVDMDGDGLLDIVWLEEGRDVANVVLGSPAGGFDHSHVITEPLYSQGRGWGDFDGDGRLDIVYVVRAAEQDDDWRVGVLLLRPDETYTEAPLARAGYVPFGFPQRVFPGDFNGDGKRDILLSMFSLLGPPWNLSSLLLGHGDGTFGPYAQVTSFGSVPLVADFNGDGRDDVVTPSMAVYTWQDDGAFVRVFQGGSNLGTPVAVGDVDQDGHLDVVTGKGVLNGRGDGTFGSLLPFDLATAEVVIAAVVADLDDDARPDIALAFAATSVLPPLPAGKAAVLMNLGGGAMGPATFLATGPNPIKIRAADLDLDGDVDLATVNSSGATAAPQGDDVSLLLGNGDGSFASHARFSAPLFDSRNPDGFVVADFDGDGLLDFGVHEAGVRILHNRGATSDADRDGILDAVDDCTDRDGDGFGDPGYRANRCVEDGCPRVVDFTQADADGDGAGDACDPCSLDAGNDVDGDGVCGDIDNCPAAANPGQDDADGDGQGDACDACVDSDHDGVGDPGVPQGACGADNCPATPNPDQADADGDGHGDACAPLDAAGLFGNPAYGAPAGHRAFRTAVADFNHDGEKDLALLEYELPGTSSVIVFLGRGDGTFRRSSRFPSGEAGFAIVAVDLDGSQGDDLIVHNWVSRELSIFLSRGDGTFAAQPPVLVGPVSDEFVAADFDEDGRADVALAGAAGLLMLAGRGDGTFGTAPSVAFPAFASLRAGDFNRDGHVDLAGSTPLNVADGGLYLAAGRGDGTFAETTAIVTGRTGDCVDADFDGDDVTDFMVLYTDEYGSRYLAFLRGHGDGTFAPPAFQGSFGGSASLFAADFDGDGRSDLGVLPEEGYGIHLLSNMEDEFWTSQGQFVRLSYSRSVTAADLNGDGRDDLAIATDASSTMFVLLSNGDLTFGEPAAGTEGRGYQGLAVSDFNGDGRADLAASVYGGRGEMLPGQGDGSFGPATAFQAGIVPVPPFVAAGDFNRDGRPDLAVAVSTTWGVEPPRPSPPGSLAILIGRGDGSFDDAMLLPSGVNPFGLALGDFDRDGFLDVAVVNGGSDHLAIHEGDGRGGFAAPITYAVGFAPYWVAADDLDGDGDLDLVVADFGEPYNPYTPPQTSGDVRILVNDGTGRFAASGKPMATGLGPTAVEVGDFNHDGRRDLAIAHGESNDVAVYLGNGDATFGLRTRYPVGEFPLALTVADLNGDGIQDLATANNGSSDVSILVGIGDGTFAAETRAWAGQGAYFVRPGHFDGDRRTDLAVTTARGIQILLNHGPHPDSDGDGSLDPVDPCTDTDRDGFGDAGVVFNVCAADNCPDVANGLQEDADGDGRGDLCDPCPTDPLNDGDRDGSCAAVDSCPTIPDRDQADADGDGVGDACDNCADVVNVEQVDTNHDGAGDACQPFLRILDIGPDENDPTTMTARVEIGNPGAWQLEGAIDVVAGSADRHVFLGDLDHTRSCQATWSPEGLAGGLGYSNEDRYGPLLFDLSLADDLYGLDCPDEVRYAMRLGRCDANEPGPGVGFVFLAELPTPIDLCVQHDADPNQRLDVTIEAFDDDLLRLGAFLPTRVQETWFGGEQSVSTEELAPGDARLTLSLSNGIAPPVTDMKTFRYEGATYFRLLPVTREGDLDSDGVPDTMDRCVDPDGDGFGDPAYPDIACLPDLCPAFWDDGGDADGDGVGDSCDTCLHTADPAQVDTNGNGFGDACEPTVSLLSLTSSGAGGTLAITALATDPSGASLTGNLFIIADDGSSFEGFEFDWNLPVRFDVGLEPGRAYLVYLSVYSRDASSVTAETTFQSLGEASVLLEAPADGNSPPEARIEAPANVECAAFGGTDVILDGGGSFDPDASAAPGDEIAAYDWILSPGTPEEQPLGSGVRITAFLPLGVTTVGLLVTDVRGATGSVVATVTVKDTVAPYLALAPSTSRLWPPNHRLVPVVVTTEIRDVCDPSPTFDGPAATSSEPDDAPGDGDGATTGDIAGAGGEAGAVTLFLRAERSAVGPGRIYELLATAQDASGNAQSALALVTVPHDAGQSPEPIHLGLEPGAGVGETRIYWNAVPGVRGYTLIAGDVATVIREGERVALGEVRALAHVVPETSISDAAAPAPGQAFFYLVEYWENDRRSGFGTEAVPWPREPSSCLGGCPWDQTASSPGTGSHRR